MKTHLSYKTLITLAVAFATVVSCRGQASESAVSTSESVSALPAGIPLGSPVGQVFKLVQANVDVGVIQSYISNCPSAFELDADKIIALTDTGLPADLLNAMFVHDKELPATVVAPAAPVAVPGQPGAHVASAESPVPPPAPSAPPTELNLNEVSQTLSPYGVWVEVEGYGRCWRPNVVVYDTSWRPYCDRGQWVYTDCGWYWNSDYAWGVTFHYGRWFNDSHHGWCWWPDTVWAPSWVTWRSGGEYCGWAPLPPYTVYSPGIGFAYRGNNVAVSFGFGLASSCYTFVSIGNFCQPHPRSYCVPPHQMTQIYNQTTVINNYNFHNRTIVNNGVSVTVIGDARHRPIQPVPIGNLSNGGRRGWNGGGSSRPARPFGADAGESSPRRNLAAPEPSHSPTVRNDGNQNTHPTADVTTARRTPFSGSTQPANHGMMTTTPATPQKPVAPVNRRDQSGAELPSRNNTPSASPAITVTVPPNHASAPVRTPDHTQPRNDALVNGADRRQPVRQVTQPTVINPAPASPRPILPNNAVAVTPPQIQVKPDLRSQPQSPSRQYNNPQPTVTRPSVPTVPPQISESRQGFGQSTSLNVKPAASALPSSQNQLQNGNPSSGWAMRNR
jgi:hypothetical protein